MGRRSIRFVFGVWVFMLSVAMFSAVLNIPLGMGAGTIYVRADGSIDPSTTPISSTDNVTYTITGDIFDSIVVERSNIVINGAGFTVQTAEYDTIGLYISGISNVTVRNTIIKGFSYGIKLNWASYCKILGNNLTSSIHIIGSSNNIIRDNRLDNPKLSGIVFWDSENNIVQNNTIYRAITDGIQLAFHSGNNTFESNNITRTRGTGISEFGYGFNWFRNNFILYNEWDGIAAGSNSNVVIGNTLAGNAVRGIIALGYNNTISYNIITSNRDGGIYVDSHNVIEGNTIANNSLHGLGIRGTGNVMRHNNFVSNEKQVELEAPDLPNVWDDSYPSGGNYWNDYNGTDLRNGLYQDLPGSDGIGDAPYIIDVSNRDRFPLMYLWSDTNPPTTNHNYSDSWHNKDFTITLTATDNRSGVSETYYIINAGSRKSVNADGQPLIDAEGANSTLQYWSIDNAGNAESHHVLTGIRLDKTAPTADAGSDRSINEDVSITLDGLSSADNIGIAGYTWAFTDVTPKTLNGEKPAYTFGNPGIYTITINVTDVAGNWATDTVVITVLDVTEPLPDAGQDQTVNAGGTVILDACGSVDNVGIVSYEWNFGDGTTGAGQITTHTYTNAGTYVATLTVKDAAGNTATHSATIIVLSTTLDETKPVANAGSDRTVNEDTQVILDGSASSDNVAVTAYTWTFTDFTIKTLTGEEPTYIFNTPGVYTITLNVTDAVGNWATDTMIITVQDTTKPAADAGQDQTVSLDAIATFDASGSTDNVGIVNYEWDFGDGTTATGKTTTHIYANPGTYTVTLTVQDASGNSAAHIVTVTVEAAPSDTFQIWIMGAAIAVIGITVGAILFLKRRK